MKLTTKQRKALDKAVEYAPKKQMLVFVWWSIFNKQKAKKLIECIESGMIWKAAYVRANQFN